MQTPDQRANQARENGAKSNGPKTEAGKERIAEANARRAQRNELLRLLLPPHATVTILENRDEFYKLLDVTIAKYRPVDGVELQVVKEIVAATWRRQRLEVVETAIWNREILRQAPLSETEEPELHSIETLVNTTIAIGEHDATLRRMTRDRAECGRLIAAAERRLVRLRRHFPGQGVNEYTSAEDREQFHVEPAVDDEPKPTEVVENTESDLANTEDSEPGEQAPVAETTSQFRPFNPVAPGSKDQIPDREAA